MLVATYNVRSFRGGVKPVAAALDGTPDVLLLQECGSRRTLASFASMLDMEFVSSQRPFSGVRNAVLWRPPWRRVAHQVRSLSRQGRALPRGFVLVHLQASRSQELAAVSAHLGLVPRERERHAREITDHVVGVEGGLVLGVDLNEGPEGPAYRWIGERLYDAFAGEGERAPATFPAAAPTARIDFLFLGEGARVVRGSVPDAAVARRASDHLPVAAEIEFEEFA
jgi:endonuclease/exonuclease/phosphatase family metal-dependent hydrolase